MKLRTYSSEGIILARKNYGEADRIITVFSKYFGKITLLAKGVRKLTSRKRGHLEIFSQIKFSANSGKGFDLITEAETINTFSKFRLNLNKVTLAYYFCEVVNKITREGEKQSKVYNLLTTALEQLETAKNLKILRKKFIEDLLVDLGYWPNDKKMTDHDIKLEEVLERKINSVRVGRKVLS
ncbi:MAG: repair protein RecO protein [Candidatus Woesebacteria bacterium GW2011_GWA1_33_30]|uniref:DNA repair protein RecO n=1 Tax=Candidatus Woesebacteria bacterium GW2011_GWA2_33_28 TaxID=1618561 RepID=A0A0F9ZVB2_9BACT|nr:MAG: repair protein RecO protein [Candidatus Woesebacteria bacterium GW2011_GWA2_33_28]KKP49135.1 MAG: repair protein RecO protein [Candidatus Woesebacteria bacterium GW2011_GWA1_33_30]KKP50265.1 MAG: repair protein RecO protein [Microgenomates group bacterium GW2011_GWC1_33_32]KKP52726.1 MAG: repair protein RecO protein [Candidatus Woesebacteria bacterium GW2011_GWB1_33_38]KKP56580.1 MAG: repair protein RecO protein [Microgenomates group bacterium GW2011_GWD1_33_9]